jgi:hypothetical protein
MELLWGDHMLRLDSTPLVMRHNLSAKLDATK